MQLHQQNDPSGLPQTLPLTDNQVDTGYMGDCACAIVLFNPVGGSYTGVRGYHGGGGLGNVNFGALFAGVPNVAATRIIMVSGTLQGSLYAITTNRDTMRAEANSAGLNNAQISCVHARSRAVVDRTGAIAFP